MIKKEFPRKEKLKKFYEVFVKRKITSKRLPHNNERTLTFAINSETNEKGQLWSLPKPRQAYKC